MYIQIKTTYPLSKQSEVLKAYIAATKKNKIPKYAKLIVPMAVSAGGKGVETFAVVEVEKGRYEDVINLIAKIEQEYHQIEGYTYQIRSWMTGPEAFATMGQEKPEYQE